MHVILHLETRESAGLPDYQITSDNILGMAREAMRDETCQNRLSRVGTPPTVQITESALPVLNQGDFIGREADLHRPQPRNPAGAHEN